MDNGRQQRGIEIATNRRIRQTNAGWLVPSQTGSSQKYAVIIGERSTCTCPDHETHGGRCKHIYAVEHMIQQRLNFDGTTTTTETVRMTETVRRTYSQPWREYNAAQTNEKDRFQVLLRDLCKGIADPPASEKGGRPRLPLADAVFAAAFKVYSTVSGRRFMSDLREAHERGHISKVPHYNSIFNYLENPDLTPLLHSLIEQSSLPLRGVECEFAVDSSGFTSSRFIRWFDHKYGAQTDQPHRPQQHDWVKVHVICGVKTNVITAVEIHERNAADTKQLPALVQATAKNFAIAEVSADKAYGSVKNANAIANAGATPFIALKRNANGSDAAGGAWPKMFGYFMYRRDEFLAHYHKRSNVEATFSMLKRKFGDSLRSKTDVAMVNESLCKILCHNLVVLIHEMAELGIEPVFWGTSNA